MCQTVGQRLRELRKLKGYSQLQLGVLLFEGVKINDNAKQLRISRLESSDFISIETRGRLAKILEVSPTDLLPQDKKRRLEKEDKHLKNIGFDEQILALIPDLEVRLKGLNGLTAFGKQLPIMMIKALEGIIAEIKETHGLVFAGDMSESPTVLKKENCLSK